MKILKQIGELVAPNDPELVEKTLLRLQEQDKWNDVFSTKLIDLLDTSDELKSSCRKSSSIYAVATAATTHSEISFKSAKVEIDSAKAELQQATITLAAAQANVREASIQLDKALEAARRSVAALEEAKTRNRTAATALEEARGLNAKAEY